MDIRYYRGFFRINVISSHDKKKVVVFLENGLIGNQTDGFKEVKEGDREVVLTRHCYSRRDKLLNYYLMNNLKKAE